MAFGTRTAGTRRSAVIALFPPIYIHESGTPARRRGGSGRVASGRIGSMRNNWRRNWILNRVRGLLSDGDNSFLRLNGSFSNTNILVNTNFDALIGKRVGELS